MISKAQKDSYLTLALTETHMPAYSDKAEQNAPIMKEIPENKAIEKFDIIWCIWSWEMLRV